MKHTEIINNFTMRLGLSEVNDLRDVPIDKAFKEYVEFYKETIVEDVIDGDMEDALLFQWGTYDWGNGKNTEIDLTRQVIIDNGLEGDDCMFQISLVYQFEPTEELEELGMSNMWFEDKEFVNDIYEEFDETKILETVLKYQVKKVEFRFETV